MQNALLYPFPFAHGTQIGKLLLPRTMTPHDQRRLLAFIRCLPTKHRCKIYDLGSHVQ